MYFATTKQELHPRFHPVRKQRRSQKINKNTRKKIREDDETLNEIEHNDHFMYLDPLLRARVSDRFQSIYHTLTK